MPRATAPLVVKLGGSVITDKTRLKTLRPRVLARLAREVKEARPLVVVHGAGSYGHQRAKRYGLSAGARGAPDEGANFARVHGDVRELHAHVLDAFARARVPAVGISPLACGVLDGGTFTDFNSEPFELALRQGLTPVTFGDAVFDRSRGFGIVSGDVLVARLAESLGARRAVYATAADGIFDKDPVASDARLLKRVTAKELDGVAWSHAKGDVTRGMGGKLDAIAALARAGVEVAVVNGNAPGRVAEALARGRVTGTLVEAGA